MVYYPVTSGRSNPEFLRPVKALLAYDKHKIATPEGWQPGDKVIVPALGAIESAENWMNEGYECTDWYFC